MPNNGFGANKTTFEPETFPHEVVREAWAKLDCESPEGFRQRLDMRKRHIERNAKAETPGVSIHFKETINGDVVTITAKVYNARGSE